jgi:hypothetical protein
MSKRNTLKQEYYKTVGYWKDTEGKPTIEYVNWLEDKLLKNPRDLLNWAKSDLAQEQVHKLGRTNTPYRADKIKFLMRAIKKLRL